MTDEETKRALEVAKNMNPDELFALCDAVIKEEEAKKARREAKEAKRRLHNIHQITQKQNRRTDT